MEIPAEFAAITAESKGEAGRAWLAELPGIVADCAARWEFAADGPVWHGYMGVVLPGRLGADGAPAVLKVSWVPLVRPCRVGRRRRVDPRPPGCLRRSRGGRPRNVDTLVQACLTATA